MARRQRSTGCSGMGIIAVVISLTRGDRVPGATAHK